MCKTELIKVEPVSFEKLDAHGLYSYLHSGLGEVDPTGQILSHEGVRVVRPLEHSLQRLQLAAVERSPVPPLLTLLLLLRVQLIVCPHHHKHRT